MSFWLVDPDSTQKHEAEQIEELYNYISTMGVNKGVFSYREEKVQVFNFSEASFVRTDIVG